MGTGNRTPVGPGHASGGLLERDAELSAIESAFAAARAGTGTLLVVEGEAGIGKSSILRQSTALARESGIKALAARGSELEQNYPFGIVLELFTPLLADAVDRADLFRGSASLAAPIFAASFDDGGHPAVADPFPTLHGLFWLTVNATDDGPLAIVVDDAHWADEPSMQFLHYLAQRLEQLPVVLIIGRRPGEGRGAGRSTPLLRDHPDAVHLEPSRLSQRAIRSLVAASGIADPDSTAARCWESTRGNPFFATELIRAIRESGPDAAGGDAPDGVPERVKRSIVGRLSRLGEPSRRVAEAIAILGIDASLSQVATLARMPRSEAAESVRRLVDAMVLRGGDGLDFIHPIARSAIYESIPTAVRASAHRDAATMLTSQHAPIDAVAVHLLSSEPAADSEVVDLLSKAAHGAMSRAAPAVARTYLRRALAEPPAPDQRPQVLIDLARADAALGTEMTVERYREALQCLTDPVERAEIMLELGHSLINAVEWEAAADAFQQGLDELGDRDPRLASRLEAGFVSAAFVSLTRRGQAEELLQRVLTVDPIDPAHRELAAWAAFQRSALVAATADEMSALVERALSGASPEELVSSGQLVEVAAGVLVATDRQDREVELLTDALEAVQRLGLQAKFGTYSYCRAWPLYYMGRLSESIADAQAAIGAHELGWETFYPATCAVLAWAHLERGEIEEAQRVIDLDDERWSQRLDYQLLVPLTRGRLALERGRLDEALHQFELAREGGVVTGLSTPVPPDWRTWMSVTLTRLGRRTEAGKVAAEGLELAERWGARWPIGVALRAAGVAEGGAEGIELLRRSVETLGGGSAQLEHARAVIVLGEALRRAGSRVEARQRLSEGADLAHGLGARALAERARRELLAAGARPRRYAISGIEALTPSELRVARMAAEGRTNREVAQALFVTPKAVEYHLANAYRKLGISSRSELAGALSPTSAAASV